MLGEMLGEMLRVPDMTGTTGMGLNLKPWVLGTEGGMGKGRDVFCSWVSILSRLRNGRRTTEELEAVALNKCSSLAAAVSQRPCFSRRCDLDCPT